MAKKTLNPLAPAQSQYDRYVAWNKINPPSQGTLLFSITLKSGNGKTGKMPTTRTGKASCPPSCPFKARIDETSGKLVQHGCYFSYFYMDKHWNNTGSNGITIDQLCHVISLLPDGTVFRHDEAGDLPGDGVKLNIPDLMALVKASRNKRAFTYTHYELRTQKERKAVQFANDNGFTINLSSNGLLDADKKLALGCGPVTTVYPIKPKARGDKTGWKKSDVPAFTPGGTPIVPCLAQMRQHLPKDEQIECADCLFCTLPKRKFVVGFFPHGTGSHEVYRIAQAHS